MISPSVVYFAIWFLVISLQSLQVLDFYEPVNVNFIFLQLGLVFILFFSELVIKVNIRPVRRSLHLSSKMLKSMHLFNKRMLFFLVFVFVFESGVSRGFPLIWLVIGDGRTHVDFGLPTLHGAFHGFLLFFATSSFLLLTINFQKKRNLFHIGLFLFYAALVFNRGIVVVFLVQALFIYLVIRGGVKISSVIYLSVFFLALVFVFGWLGDLRSGHNLFSNSVSDDWVSFFEIFPESLLWFYAYFTGGVNNLYYNIVYVEPTYVPLYTFAKLVPTVVYDFMDMSKMVDSFVLADGRLTVSTGFQGLISDFGLFGMLGYLPIIILAQIFYRKAQAGSVRSILLYGILMQSTVMTVYIDTVFYLPFLLQLFLVFIFIFRINGLADSVSTSVQR